MSRTHQIPPPSSETPWRDSSREIGCCGMLMKSMMVMAIIMVRGLVRIKKGKTEVRY
jgi:hypothetical protein